jgi:hypothetical protein
MPKTSKNENRTEFLPALRCTKTEKAHILAKAESAKKSLSDYRRFQLLEREAPSPDPYIKFDPEVAYHLGRIGNNLNQLTKEFKSNGYVPLGLSSMLEELTEYLHKNVYQGDSQNI